MNGSKNQVLFLFLLFFLITGFVSCESILESLAKSDDECEDYDYSDCNTAEPDNAALQIRLSVNDENPYVEIIVYTGNMEKNDVFSRDTVNETYYEVDVPLNKYYSATAKYKVGDNIVVAVDGDRIEKKSRDVCDSTCWRIKGGDLDLRLKYTDL